MTCIAAISENNTIYMGADSAGVGSYYTYSIRSDKKIFIKNSFIFGFTSSYRMGQLLKYSLNIPEKPSELSQEIFIHTLFIESIRKCLKDNGYSEIKDNTEKGGTFIFGYNGLIYKVESDFQINETTDSFACCGCGRDWADAVLYITQEKNIKPKERIKQALETSEHFCCAIKKPFEILTLNSNEAPAALERE